MTNYPPRETDIPFDIDSPHESYDLAVEACREFDFAILRNVVGWEEQAEVQEQAKSYSEEGGLESGFRYQASANQGIYERSSLKGDLMTMRIPTLVRVVVNAAVGLSNAATRNGVMRMYVGDALTIDTFVCNSYPPGGYIGPHIDDNVGIALALSTQGIGLVTLSSAGTQHREVRTVLEPFDMMVLPAKVDNWGGTDQQATHQVENITPLSQEAGIRRSIAAIYRSY